MLLFVLSLEAGTIRVAVAANVSYAMHDLITVFHHVQPQIKVQVTLGGTGKLTAQIRHGAPYDLFMAANMAYPEALYAEGMATGRPRIYAQGALALLSTKPRDFSKGLALLKEESILKIAIANPKTAPYGRASFEALEQAGMLEGLKTKFVYGESISQTVAHTVTAADIGFIAKSSLYSPQMSHYRQGIHWRVVPNSLYKAIDQGIVILDLAKANASAKAFYDFMLGPEAGKILKQYGYTLP